MKGLPLHIAPTSRRRRFSTTLFFLAATLLTVLALLSLFAVSPCAIPGAGKHCYHGYSSDFSFSAEASEGRASWMARLPDSVNLSSLSIPGTHDTMTYGMPADPALQCQNKNLATQLRSGLRYFDIRGRLSKRSIWVYHAWSWTGFTLSQVLQDMFEFLDQNPGEALVVRLKEEGPPVNDDSGRTFEEAFLYFLMQDPLIGPQLQKRLYLPPGNAEDPKTRRFFPLPDLGALRGKILLLQNFPDSRSGPYGVAWEGPQMLLEDLWQIPSVDDLPRKWTAVHDALKRARDDADDNSVLYLAHLSCSFGVLPIEAAAGPLRVRGVDGINDQTGRWLEGEGKKGRTGVVIIDFPGQELIDAVIGRNDVFIQGR